MNTTLTLIKCLWDANCIRVGCEKGLDTWAKACGFTSNQTARVGAHSSAAAFFNIYNNKAIILVTHILPYCGFGITTNTKQFD